MKRHAPAAARNGAAILAHLQRLLPETGVVLEVASGTGQHAALFAAALAPLKWQPSDVDDDALRSIEAYRHDGGLANMLPPARLDVATPPPQAPVEPDAIVCINMIHISPWRCTVGLFEAAARWLPTGGPLICYGPYRFGGRFTTQSNATFDAGLRHQNPAWGVRDVDELNRLATSNQLHNAEVIDMPANNHLLVFRR